jgi:phenylalanyl-tRNA synthetase beta chain
VLGARHELQWGESERLVDFFDIKGDVMSLLVQMGCEESSIRWVSQEHAALHEGQSAQVFFKETLVGWVGALHPTWVSACDFLAAPYLFELDCSLFSDPGVVKYEPFSKYPGMSRDLALVVNSTVLAQDLQFYIESIGGYLLNKVTIFDIYEGEAVSSNEKSVGLRLYFQGQERQFVVLVVSELMVKIVSALEKEFGARLRG